MKHIQIKACMAPILNIAIFLLTAAAIGWYFTEQGLTSGAGNMDSGGVGCFRFFTNDSNIFAALCSLLLSVFQLRALLRGTGRPPQWMLLLKFVGTTAVTLTFMVVILFLGPIMGYRPMFSGSCLALHLICPLLAILSFCFFDSGTAPSKKQALLGIVPTVIYGTVYLVNVIFTGAWSDFYHFNIGGCWYISYVVLTGATYLFALALCAIHRRTEGRTD